MIIQNQFASFHTSLLMIVIILSIIIFIVVVLCIWLYFHRKYQENQLRIALTEKSLLYTCPGSIVPNRNVFPLPRIPTIPYHIQRHVYCGNYPNRNSTNGCHLVKEYNDGSSSDRPTASAQNRLIHSKIDPVETKKQSFHSVPTVSSKSTHSPFDDACNHPGNSSTSERIPMSSIMINTSSLTSNCSFPRVLTFEIRYYLKYDDDTEKLLFRLERLRPMQTLIEQYFFAFKCQIKLVVDDKSSGNVPQNSTYYPPCENHIFDLNRSNLNTSYVKIIVSGNNEDEKEVELAQTVLVIRKHLLNYQNYLNSLNTNELHNIKIIQIYEDKIDLIHQHQIMCQHATNALLSLAYQNDHSMLHVGLIKILRIQQLFKDDLDVIHHHDRIQIQIHAFIDGHAILRQKSDWQSINRNSHTYSGSFRCGHLSIDKLSIRLIICYRPFSIRSGKRSICFVEFNSTRASSQQACQHWNDVLSLPNRPHVQWYQLQTIKPSLDRK